MSLYLRDRGDFTLFISHGRGIFYLEEIEHIISLSIRKDLEEISLYLRDVEDNSSDLRHIEHMSLYSRDRRDISVFISNG